MKKIILFLLSMILSVSFAGCGLTEEDVSTISTVVDILTGEPSTETSLIIYDKAEETVTGSSQLSVAEDEISTQVSDEVTEEVRYYFKNKNLLNQHYEKHGIEMGFDSAESYEKAASDVINNPSALTKTEQEDGDYVYYIEETNEFVILSTNGFIRTYFLPSAGKKYFDKQ